MTSDSSASTTPMILTPDSTGAGSSSSPDAATVKKARRQTAIYPNMNSTNKPLKPFSRSAAKRGSVMALGSIEHLQHYFTKTGIAAKKNPKLDKPHYGLVPAIGGTSHVRSPPSVGSLQEFLLPPPPVVPNPPAFPPFVKTYEVNPESLLPGVIENLTVVAHAWCIDNTTPTSTTIDVLNILQTTTRAIRAVRNYVLSLPDESAGTIRSQFRSKILGPGKSINLPSSSSPDPLTLIRKSALEVLTVLRELEETCRLPLSDDAYDAQSDVGNPRGTEAMELLPDESDIGSIDQDPYLTYSLVQVEGRFESIPVWEDEEDSSFVFGDEDDGKEKREPWDERLVVGNGWLYRQDVKLEDLERERKVLLSYVDVVDEVLFGGSKEFAERGWEREKRKLKGRGGPRPKNRRVSAGDGEGRSLGVVSDGGRRRVSMGMVDLMGGMSLSEEPEQMDDIGEDVGEDESMDDDELPEWARKSNFIEDNLGRAHSLLLSFLPSALQPALQPSSPREAFLESLSSGQLLCTAYNSCVRKSKKPWGYVSKDGIHDIIALEKSAEADLEGEASAAPGKKSGWTFRRTDNLRLWAGALKLRYMLPIQTPYQPLKHGSGANNTPAPGAAIATPLGSPVKQRFSEPPLVFDAKLVARKEEGWDAMLEEVLMKWVWKVVEEQRSTR